MNTLRSRVRTPMAVARPKRFASTQQALVQTWRKQEMGQRLPPPASRTYTDEEGWYELRAVAGKKHRIVAGGGEYSNAKSELFTVEEGDVYDVEDLYVRQGTSSIEGVVVDPDGNPISTATINATSKSKEEDWTDPRRSDSDGRFRINYVLADELLSVTVSKLDYHVRHWKDIAPGTRDLRFVLYPTQKDPPDPGKTRPHNPEMMVGKAAPEWDVERWINKPLTPVGPSPGDEKTTLVMFVPSTGVWFNTVTGLKQLQDEPGIIPVVILGSTVDESTVRPALDKYGLKLAVGIDRFDPQSHSDATWTAYGFGRWDGLMHVMIDSNGIVRAIPMASIGVVPSQKP